MPVEMVRDVIGWTKDGRYRMDYRAVRRVSLFGATHGKGQARIKICRIVEQHRTNKIGAYKKHDDVIEDSLD